MSLDKAIEHGKEKPGRNASALIFFVVFLL